MMERTIIHLNVADFAVAVERTLNPGLRDWPVIIAPRGSARAVVYDMSEEAYQCGVRKAMPVIQARRYCPEARIMPPRLDRYEQAMKQFVGKALPFSPLIESGENDGHVFVDVTGTHRLFGPPVDVAWRLQKAIGNDLGLNPIWTLASNKLVAKVASRLVKPIGEYIVDAGDEEGFLAPLPVELIPGIERQDLALLRQLNLTRVFQVTGLGQTHLQIPFGNRARFILDTLRGVDPTPVLPVGKRPPKIRVSHDFDNDTNDLDLLEAVVYTLVERIGFQLRQQRMFGRRIGLVLDYADGIRRIRQASVQPPSANDMALFETAKKVFYWAWNRRVRVRHIRIDCDRLIFPPIQMPLFPELETMSPKAHHLISAMDAIRTRFGSHAIQTGRTMRVIPRAMRAG